MNDPLQIDPNLHNSANLMMVAVSIFGSIISHITASGTAAFFTTLLAVTGIVSYIYANRIKKVEGEKFRLEIELKKLEIKELKEKHIKVTTPPKKK